MIINGAPIILTVTDEQVTLERPPPGACGDGGGGKPQHRRAPGWFMGLWEGPVSHIGGHLLGPGSRPVCSQKTLTHIHVYIHPLAHSVHAPHVPSAWNILPAPPPWLPLPTSRVSAGVSHSLEGPSRTILFPVEPPPPPTHCLICSHSPMWGMQKWIRLGFCPHLLITCPMCIWATKLASLHLTLLMGTKSPGIALLGDLVKGRAVLSPIQDGALGPGRCGSSPSSAPMTPTGDLEMTLFHGRKQRRLREGAMLQPSVHRLQFVSLWGWWCMNLQPGSLPGSRDLIQGLGEAWGLETSRMGQQGRAACCLPALLTSLFSCPRSSFQPV